MPENKSQKSENQKQLSRKSNQSNKSLVLEFELLTWILLLFHEWRQKISI